MKLEDQVASLELSKKLKELGLFQDSFFYWSNPYSPYPRLVTWQEPAERSGDFWISAYSVAELGEMLPDYAGNFDWLTIMKDNEGWNLSYDSISMGDHTDHLFSLTGFNEANLRADALIYLIENKFMEIPK